MNTNDLESKILHMFDGGLPADEVAKLELELLENADSRETYRRLARLHSTLETLHESRATVAGTRVVPMDRIMDRQRRRMVKLSLGAAAALVLISVVILSLMQLPAPAIASFRALPGSVFSLTHVGGEAREGNVLAEGSELRLVSGTVEGVFQSGVRVVIEAPCALRVLGEDLVALDDGVAWFEVPPEAVGFSVESRELAVVDLGTAFGVVSSVADRDEIHVTEGSVEVSLLAGGDKKVLTAGRAVRVLASGNLQEMAAEERRFVTKLLETRPIAVVNHSFEADRLPRDGDLTTKLSGSDDYDKDVIPDGWFGFDDGDGAMRGARGILSTAADSAFSESLKPTPDSDGNDQVFYSAARDIYQVLDEPLQANSTYVLTVDIGDRNVRGSEGDPGNPGFRLGYGEEPGAGLLRARSELFPPQIDGGWVTWSATYTTGPSPQGLGQPLRIELTSGSRVAWFDRVRLTVARPH